MTDLSPPIKAKQVSSLGETPAEARARMTSEASPNAIMAPPETVSGPVGVPGDGNAMAKHIAAMREAEGFAPPPETSEATAEDAPDSPDAHPSPTKAIEMIRQLGQDKIQLQTELDAALNIVERYRAAYGDLD